MKPLAGVRVVEAAQMVAGPLAGMVLAEQGAEVIKVEVPDGVVVGYDGLEMMA